MVWWLEYPPRIREAPGSNLGLVDSYFKLTISGDFCDRPIVYGLRFSRTISNYRYSVIYSLKQR